jgi:hypothetical protein
MKMKKVIIRLLAAAGFLSVSGIALAQDPVQKEESQIVALDDSQMDQISAGRISVSSSGGAFTSLGQAFSLSFTEVITRGQLTIARAFTISYASGVNAVAFSAASALVTGSVTNSLSNSRRR